MSFIKDVNLVAIACGTVSRRIAQLADLVDPTVCGCIDFDHVHRTSCANLLAGITNSARLRRGFIARAAVQCHGENPRDRGFSDTTVPTKDVAVRHALLSDCVLQSAGYVVLANDIGKALWPVFSGENLITHGGSCVRLYRLQVAEPAGGLSHDFVC